MKNSIKMIICSFKFDIILVMREKQALCLLVDMQVLCRFGLWRAALTVMWDDKFDNSDVCSRLDNCNFGTVCV